ncbi:MAG: hypothetical protein K6E30_09095 [Lachnospiraceae bacterium]|nr:hypothetical protein [Lachnospiraceae bacterium]
MALLKKEQKGGSEHFFLSHLGVLLTFALAGTSVGLFTAVCIQNAKGEELYPGLLIGFAAGALLGILNYLVRGCLFKASGSMDSKAGIILSLFGIYFLAITLLIVSQSDLKSPVITFDESVMIRMKEGDLEDTLLANISAEDEEDGKLDDQLSIASFAYSPEGTSAEVIYTVRDLAGNEARASQMVEVEGRPWPVKQGES